MTTAQMIHAAALRAEWQQVSIQATFRLAQGVQLQAELDFLAAFETMGEAIDLMKRAKTLQERLELALKETHG